MNATTQRYGKLEITTPSDREISMTRVFDAPRQLVFDAHTKPELVRRWLGFQNGWSMPVCEIDFRVGGSYRYVWEKNDGTYRMGMGGVYREIVEPERIVNTEKFDEAWYPGDAIDTLTLVERKGKTTLTMTVRYASKEARDEVLESPMATGVAESFNNLESLLESLLASGDAGSAQ
jgi:uncharacterized protein YndB with AHSA1/START domain